MKVRSYGGVIDTKGPSTIRGKRDTCRSWTLSAKLRLLSSLVPTPGRPLTKSKVDEMSKDKIVTLRSDIIIAAAIVLPFQVATVPSTPSIKGRGVVLLHSVSKMFDVEHYHKFCSHSRDQMGA